MDPEIWVLCLEDGSSGPYIRHVRSVYTVTDYFFLISFIQDYTNIRWKWRRMFKGGTLLSDKTHVKFTLSMTHTLTKRISFTLDNVF